MRILYLNTLYAPHVGGGAEVTLRTLVEGMHQRGHEVVVLTTGPGAGIQEDTVNGVRVLRAGLTNIYWHHRADKATAWRRGLWHLLDIYNPAMGKVVEQVVRHERPDVVSCHNLPGWSVAAWGAIKRAGVPIVQVLHDLYALCPNSNMFRDGRSCETQCARCRLLRLPHPRLSAQVDAVVGVSRYVLGRHLHAGYFQRARIKTSIHNVRDIQIVRRNGSVALTGAIRFGFIGTLTRSKGIELLLSEFKRADLRNAQLIVAGTGDSRYESHIRNFSANNVQFIGRADPETFFSSIDVLVVPSIWNDTLPGVVFESLIFGVPVIGSRMGGIPEMIENGVNGYIFDPRKPGELGALLGEVAQNPKRLELMRAAVARSASAYVDRSGWYEKYEKLYTELSSVEV